MRQLPVRVVKVGGSLFDFEGLVPALREWIDTQSPATHILIAGGGPFTDVVRQIDDRFSIGSVNSHWMCVRLLDCTTRMMVLLLPEADLVTRFEELEIYCQYNEGRIVAFSCEQFLQQLDPQAKEEQLPQDWSVTTDSIAARLSSAIDADELVLLKSCDPIPLANAPQLALAGYTDDHFGSVAAGLDLRWVNLRSGEEWWI
ncbi:MAG TPA: hypothetical protein EYG57_05660 [Planctomycetes bacterium]|nr:hypothetical protein [Planctomycetaceae bacterium]HIM29025.1 hypothetical protein [Planctomycetota bacterium]